ncbi:MAG: acyl-CoA dehydrogenase family protein [Oligoflexus sp.]
MTNSRQNPSLEELTTQVRSLVNELIQLEPAFLSQNMREFLPLLEAKREEVKKQGLWGLALSEDLGGHGLSLDQFAVLAEEMGRSPLAHYAFGCQAPEAGNIELLHLHGSPQQKEQVLQPLIEGKIRSCFAMTEKNTSGANPTELQTRAHKTKDGWRLEGEKWFTTAADGADYVIVMAVTDPAAAPHQRASMFLLPMKQAGLQFVRNISVMGHAGAGPFSHAELKFDACEVSDEALIGAPGDGFRLAQARLGHGRIHHCARWLGIADRALELMVARVRNRQIAADRRLAQSDVIQSWIAEAAADITASRLFVRHTAQLIEEGGSRAARSEISMIKFFVAGKLGEILDRAIQCYGAAGVSDDFILAFFYREERAARIYDGPDEVHKISLARHIIKSMGEQ